MSRFDSLRSSYSGWHKGHIEYMRRCSGFLRDFATGFRTYVEAPEYYRAFDGDGTATPYVSVMETSHDIHGEVSYSIMQRNKPFPDLIRDHDGYWLGAVRIVVEMGPNTEPRKPFAFPVRFVLRGDQCTMQVGTMPTMTFDINDPQGAHKIYDQMVSWLEELFATAPWETASEPERIGFIV